MAPQTVQKVHKQCALVIQSSVSAQFRNVLRKTGPARIKPAWPLTTGILSTHNSGTCTSSCSSPHTSSASPCATSCHSYSEQKIIFTFSLPVSVLLSSHVVFLLLVSEGRLHEFLQRPGVLHPLYQTNPGEGSLSQYTYYTLLQHTHIHVLAVQQRKPHITTCTTSLNIVLKNSL